MFEEFIWKLLLTAIVIAIWIGLGFIFIEFVRYLGMCQGL